MKKIFTFMLLAFMAANSFAQKPADYNKAVVNVIAYDAQGNVLNSAYGFIFGATTDKVNVVAPFLTLKGASRAEVIDWKGQRADVQRIIGASSDYDMSLFSAALNMKKGTAIWGEGAKASKDQTLQVAYYSTDKKALPETTTVTTVDEYNGHNYYEISLPNEERFFGCPLLDAEGNVVAVVQKNVQKEATTACAIDVNFVHDFQKKSSFSALSADLNAILIPKSLPEGDGEQQSYLYLLFHSAQDSTLVITASNDYLAQPDADPKVYADRATYYATHGDYKAADADIQKAVQQGTAWAATHGAQSLADIYNAQSLLMYNKVVYGSADPDPYPAWTLDAALEASDKAYATEPLPAYMLQKGQVLFSLQKYQEAYEAFTAVNATEIANQQTFYFAANSLERAGGPDEQIVALLDSAVNRLPQPYNAEAAPYLLARAQHLDNAGLHRRATADYNEYEKLVGTRNLNAYFYYLRMQSEVGSRMYQQALDDIHTAILRAETAEDKADYLYDCACLQLQVAMYDECIESCKQLLELVPTHAEGYKICGVAYGEKKVKAQAVQYLKKAVELKAENAEKLLEKYM